MELNEVLREIGQYRACFSIDRICSTDNCSNIFSTLTFEPKCRIEGEARFVSVNWESIMYGRLNFIKFL